MKKIIFAAALSASALFAQIPASNEVPYIPFEVKMGKGFDAVQANCLTCHSFGYVINQGRQSRKFWQGKVNKMMVHFKAPITKDDAKTVVNYLATYYGNGK